MIFYHIIHTCPVQATWCYHHSPPGRRSNCEIFFNGTLFISVKEGLGFSNLNKGAHLITPIFLSSKVVQNYIWPPNLTQVRNVSCQLISSVLIVFIRWHPTHMFNGFHLIVWKSSTRNPFKIIWIPSGMEIKTGLKFTLWWVVLRKMRNLWKYAVVVRAEQCNSRNYF